MRSTSFLCGGLLALFVLQATSEGALPNRALMAAREAYLASDFDQALAATAGQQDLEAKLINCLSLYERYKLYRVADDGKRAKVLFNILKIDLTMEVLDGLHPYFNAPGHVTGNGKATDLLQHVLRRSGTAQDCRIIVRLLQQDIGEEAALAGYRALERHLEHVRKYVNRGGTMPEVERTLFQDETLQRVLLDGLTNKRMDGAALAGLVAIEEAALPFLEQRNDNLSTAQAILKIKEARNRRLKAYPNSTWDSAFGRGDVPAPAAL